jgi:hypothetical protein
MVDTDFRWEETPELQATEEVAGSAWARIAWEAAMANNPSNWEELVEGK